MILDIIQRVISTLVSRIPSKYLVWILLLILLPTFSIVWLTPGGFSSGYTTYIQAISKTPRAIKWGSNTFPLQDEQRTKLNAHIQKYESQLRDVFQQRYENEYMNSWATAQVVMALGTDTFPDILAVVGEFLSADDRDHDTKAWKEFKDGNVHNPATSWIIMSLSSTGISSAILEPALNFLEGEQASRGYWTTYAVTLEKDESASTYATLLALMALNAWVDRDDLLPETRTSLEGAVSKAVNWVLNNRDETSWFWYDYPRNVTERTFSLSLTSLAVHVLRHVKIGKERFVFSDVAGYFIDNVASNKYSPWSKEVPGIVLPSVPGHDLTHDFTRFYILPWMIIATVDAYPSLSFTQRIRAIVFIDGVLDQLDDYDTSMSVEARPWVAAEYLLSLKYTRENSQ